MTDRIDFHSARGPRGLRVYAIGDIHGRLDLLTSLHGQIHADIERDEPIDWRIIHLGDYTDRGPDSRGVLDFLLAATRSDDRILTLAGNHDLGFLDFLDDPDPDALFMRFGGIETARSYGVTFDQQRSDPFEPFHAMLAQNVPTGHIALLRNSPFSVAFGDFFFCHAGIRPGVPLNRQDPEDLVWIREGFLDQAGLHAKVIVHGHTIVPAPAILPNRVGIDTGAYRTGMLTALVIDGDEKRFIST